MDHEQDARAGGAADDDEPLGLIEVRFASMARGSRNPVSPGHTLIITRRVVADWFSASHEECAAVFDLIETVKRQLDAGPVLLQPRWAMSFLRGPMTRHELSQALKARTAPAESTDVAPDHDHAIAAE